MRASQAARQRGNTMKPTATYGSVVWTAIALMTVMAACTLQVQATGQVEPAVPAAPNYDVRGPFMDAMPNPPNPA